LLFKLSDDLKTVIVDCEGAPDASHEELMSKLSPKDCRYAVSMVHYDSPDGPREKLVFIMWAPDTAPLKAKMIYAGTKDSVKKALVGVQVEIHGTDATEITMDAIIDKCKSIK